MKKLIVIALMCIAGAAIGQTRGDILRQDKLGGVTGISVVVGKGDSIKVSQPGSGLQTPRSNSGNTAFEWIRAIASGDTAAMLSSYYHTASAALKLNISDTAAMLGPYYHTASAALKLNISDTAAMLGPYYHTASAALKLNISDTAAMLGPYYHTATAALKLNISDTAAMLGPYYHTATAALKLNISDTAAMLGPYYHTATAALKLNKSDSTIYATPHYSDSISQTHGYITGITIDNTPIDETIFVPNVLINSVGLGVVSQTPFGSMLAADSVSYHGSANIKLVDSTTTATGYVTDAHHRYKSETILNKTFGSGNLWNGTAVDSAYVSNMVSKLVNGTNTAVAQGGGKTWKVNVTGNGSMFYADSANFHGNNNLTTVGDISAGKWVSTAIDSTYLSNVVSKLVNGTNTTAAQGGGKTWKVNVSGNGSMFYADSGNYTGNTNQTKVGTIVTGVWHGTAIDSSYTANTVTKVYRKPGSDSVFVWMNGTKLFVYKDSIGSGGSSTVYVDTVKKNATYPDSISISKNGTTWSIKDSIGLTDDPEILAFQSLGSVIKALPIGTTLANYTGSIALGNSTMRYNIYHVVKRFTMTGVKYFVAAAPTASFENNYNGFLLYTLSGGTCTFKDSTTRDTAIFDDATQWKTKTFQNSWTFNPGDDIVITVVWNRAAASGAPSMLSTPALNSTTVLFDLANSVKIAATKSSVTAPVTGTTAYSTLSAATNIIGMFPY